MKGAFSMWAFFGATFWIDVFTHFVYPVKEKRIDPYNPVRKVSVIVPVHNEQDSDIKDTITAIYSENYPINNVIICSDSESDSERIVKKLHKDYNNLYYIECPNKSKAKKINHVVSALHKMLGEFICIRDCRVKGNANTIERMVSYFSDENIGAVTSYGRVSIPKNFLSRSYFYGKAWVNEIGRFRKNAQEKRGAVYVICGASTIFRKDILENIPIPSVSKTEDTHYTWILQRKGLRIRVADDAIVSSPEIDGRKLEGIISQIKQSYRWSSGNIQSVYIEGRDLFKNKRLAYTTIIPGFIEAVMYSIALLLFPFLYFISPTYSLAFLIGDTTFSLLGTLIILPKKFLKTLIHYHQVFFFKYLNSAIFLYALTNSTIQAWNGDRIKWSNEWSPPKTNIR